MHIIPLLNDFLRHIELERNLSHHTVSQYARDLNHWLFFFEMHNIPLDTDAVTVQIMRHWLQNQAESGRQPPTINRSLCCIRTFWKFLRRFHNLEHDPMSALVGPIAVKLLPETLKQSEVMALYQACDLNHYQFHQVSDRAIIAILACLGLRRQELIDIRVEDFNSENKTLLVRSLKRGRKINPADTYTLRVKNHEKLHAIVLVATYLCTQPHHQVQTWPDSCIKTIVSIPDTSLNFSRPIRCKVDFTVNQIIAPASRR